MSILERFKLTYNRHSWMRVLCCVTLLAGAYLVFVQFGGFPPATWHLLAGTVPHVSQLWQVQGAAMLPSLALLSLQSLASLLVWLTILCGWVAILRHWRQQVRERKAFARNAEEQFAQAIQKRQEELERLEQLEQMKQQQLAQAKAYATQFRAPTVALPAVKATISTLPAQQRYITGQLHTNGDHTNQINTEQQGRRGEKIETPVQWQRNMQLCLELGSGWDVGIKRKQQPNEDSMVAMQGTCIYNNALTPFALLVVADGMGGHAAGQDASYLAISAMMQWVMPHIAGVHAMSDELLAQLLVDGVRQANLAVYQRGQEIGADMGTTITTALVLNSKAYVANVGDSRTYLYREGVGLRQITHDHSLVARLVAEGRIRPDQVYTHPDRNQIYRGLGDKRDVEVDSFMLTVQAGDSLLLCSDGLWEMVRDPEIERTLQHSEWNPMQTSKALIQSALHAGGLDNISAIVARVTPVTL